MPIPPRRKPPPILPRPAWRIVQHKPIAPDDRYQPIAPAAAWAGASTEVSKNWSGAYLRALGDDRLTFIRASWIVPEIRPSGRPSGALGSQWDASIWIGLDGHDAASRSMPQMGTSQLLTIGEGGVWEVSYTAWWWWWMRDAGLDFPPLIPITVRAGDTVICEITTQTPELVQMAMTNSTLGIEAAAMIAAPTAPLAAGGARQCAVEGRSAEWIVERPCDPETERFQMLPDVGRVIFSDCAATLRNAGLDRQVYPRRASYIRMQDWDDALAPGIVVAEAAPGPPGSPPEVHVQYAGSTMP